MIKFGDSRIFLTEIMINSILQVFDQKNQKFFEFFVLFFWFKFNNLDLTLDMDFPFYNSVAIKLKRKFRNKIQKLLKANSYI